jgi:2-polyprenyl-3-methyl-5-hydroxy-6-metoxy-1,4-benzoquinol methylase
MERAAVSNLISRDEFVRVATEFKARLAATNSFEEMLVLWRSTSIAYSYDALDPFSPEYRGAVLDVYQKLTQIAYDEQSELTSTKQSDESFEIGYPWVSRNLGVISQELSKAVQALAVFHARGLGGKSFIEFGAGWGNLAVPLAKSGQEVAVVDIDGGFLSRISRIAAQENVQIACFQGGFLEVARSLPKKYDVAIFQSSFHHCLEFDDLLQELRDRVIDANGSIYFFAEPIYKDYTFPWGLRYDGESLWAITFNHWLELGFDEDFFFTLLLRRGFLLSKFDPIYAFVGEGWVAEPGEKGVAFEAWALPEEYDATFAARNPVPGYGRFCLERSVLPGLRGGDKNIYLLEFQSFRVKELRIEIITGASRFDLQLPGCSSCMVEVKGDCDQVLINSETYVPDEEAHNGDIRRVGVALKRVFLEDSMKV